MRARASRAPSFPWLADALRRIAPHALAYLAIANLAAAAARLDDLEAFLEQFVELLDRAAFPQHVPGCARHLDLLGFGQLTTLDHGALHAVAAQPGAGDGSVVSEGDLELLAVVGAVPRDLTRLQFAVALGLIAHAGSDATALHAVISHHQHSSLLRIPACLCRLRPGHASHS